MRKFVFDCLPPAVPQHLLEKIPPHLLAGPGEVPSGIISTALPWGTVDENLVQRLLNAYGTIPETIYVFLVTDSTKEVAAQN